jgi:hypothetical protein
MKLFAYMFILQAVALGQVPHQHHPPSSDEYAKVLEVLRAMNGRNRMMW